ncbi:MAG: VOC family protein [Burkholderiaceae bacterium]|nr:VOC family protein [Burkholderiaceae bacterium]MDP3753312.1 VOC family protein [Polaromonas sp.]
MSSKAAVIALAGLRLQVRDLARSKRFYTQAWGLVEVGGSLGSVMLRARSERHHALEIVEGDSARLIGIDLEVRNRENVDALVENSAALGCVIARRPGLLDDASGGGYGASIVGLEGLHIVLHCEQVRNSALPPDGSKPSCLTHVVLNSSMVDRQVTFFAEVLGFKISDVTARMSFLRCDSAHHSIAFAHGEAMSLNHAAFEMDDIDGLMYGSGRLIENDHAIEWGPGRHGPGNNIFCYFIDPDGFAVEYTTGMEQIEDDGYQARDTDYWTNFPRRPCRWGVARKPSDNITFAFSGRGESQ